MKNFHITIKDLETGETTIDKDVSAIIGAVGDGEGAVEFCLVDCDSATLAKTCAGAQTATLRGLDMLPGAVVKKIKKYSKAKVKQDP